MKKQLSTAMAAAMAFGTVVPAFAAENKVQAKAETINTADVRTARGLEIAEVEVEREGSTTKATVVTRAEVYNYNGYSANERTKHTLKSAYKDMQVLFEERNEKDANKDLIVLGKKMTDIVKVATEKAKYDVMINEIQNLEKNSLNTKKVETTPSKTTSKTVDGKEIIEYVPGKQVITVFDKDNKEHYKATFENIDNIVVTNGDVSSLRKDVFGSLKITDGTGVTVTDGAITVDFKPENVALKDEAKVYANIYNAANKLKFAIENNKDKFDIVSNETGVGNADRKVELYVKGANKNENTLVMTLTFKDVKEVESSKIINMPSLKDADFKGHWAESTIVNSMVSGHIDASSTFRPKDSVTRAEFAKMLCTVLGIETNNKYIEPFSDVEKGDWYHKYIAALYNTGDIINGYEDNTFKPNNSITRQEAAKMIAQALVIKNYDNLLTDGKLKFEDEKGKLVSYDGKRDSIEYVYSINGSSINIDSKTSFKDDAEIKVWADASVESLKQAGVINGYDDNTFKPNNSITRVEALLMITGDNRKN